MIPKKINLSAIYSNIFIMLKLSFICILFRGICADVYNLPVEGGKTYLLRIVNAALNEELFFKIAGHKLTVVEVDATYVKPFKIETIVIAPGQTTNVLLNADQKSGKYLVAASPFMDAPVAVDNLTATATLHYTGTLATTPTFLTTSPPKNATQVANNFISSLRGLNSKKFPVNVPLTVDHSLSSLLGWGLTRAHLAKLQMGAGWWLLSIM